MSLFVSQRASEIQLDRLVPSGPMTMHLTNVFKLDGTASVNPWRRAARDVVTTVAAWNSGKLSLTSENPEKMTWKEDIYLEGKCLVVKETTAGGKPIKLRYAPSYEPRVGARKFPCDGAAKGV